MEELHPTNQLRDAARMAAAAMGQEAVLEEVLVESGVEAKPFDKGYEDEQHYLESQGY